MHWCSNNYFVFSNSCFRVFVLQHASKSQLKNNVLIVNCIMHVYFCVVYNRNLVSHLFRSNSKYTKKGSLISHKQLKYEINEK